MLTKLGRINQGERVLSQNIFDRSSSWNLFAVITIFTYKHEKKFTNKAMYQRFIQRFIPNYSEKETQIGNQDIGFVMMLYVQTLHHAMGLHCCRHFCLGTLEHCCLGTTWHCCWLT